MKHTIQLKPLTKSPKNLKQHICNLLLKLIVSPDGSVAATKLKILILYKYQIRRNEHQDTTITVPIALVPPLIYNEDDVLGIGEACNSLNDSILNWFKLNSPSIANGQLIFSSTFYSGVENNQRTAPLFVLDDIVVPLTDIDDLSIRAGLQANHKINLHSPKDIVRERAQTNLQTN